MVKSSKQCTEKKEPFGQWSCSISSGHDLIGIEPSFTIMLFSNSIFDVEHGIFYNRIDRMHHIF